MPARKKAAGTQQDQRPGRALALMPSGGALEVPLMPTGLLKDSQQKWETYWESTMAGVTLRVDLPVVERWIYAYDEWKRALTAFRRKRLVEGSMKQPVLNPLSTWVTSREGQLARCEAELGLTPMARMKLGIAVGQAKLTAAELNRMIEEDDDGEDGVIDAAEAELLGEFETG